MIASASLVALGAAGVQVAANAQGFASTDTSKPWSLSATLRGFYDDNYVNAASSSKLDSFGFEVSPSASASFSQGQTSGSVRYTYSLRYYQDRADRGFSSADHAHEAVVTFDHAFTERYSVNLSDSFVIGQEPELLAAGLPLSTLYRMDGNNMRNWGTISFNAQLTPLLGAKLTYVNRFYDYEQEGGDPFAPSRSGLLDRIEHLGALDLRWQALPQTVAIVGYQYGQVDYTSDEIIVSMPIDPFDFDSSIRNNRSHYGYLGVEHNFNPDLFGAIRGGVQHVNYYNEPGDITSLAPYVDASLKYRYTADSHVEAGFRHSFHQTDLLGASDTGVTTDAEASSVYASLNHKITPYLTGSLLAQYQHDKFNGGAYDGQSENFYIAGVNLEYQFDQHLAAHVGYNYDRLVSDVAGRDFTRNRVYLGVTASY